MITQKKPLGSWSGWAINIYLLYNYSKYPNFFKFFKLRKIQSGSGQVRFGFARQGIRIVKTAKVLYFFLLFDVRAITYCVKLQLPIVWKLQISSNAATDIFFFLVSLIIHWSLRESDTIDKKTLSHKNVFCISRVNNMSQIALVAC